ncbi:hypothetical protein LDFHOB_04195 [Candidatus Electronema aureum]
MFHLFISNEAKRHPLDMTNYIPPILSVNRINCIKCKFAKQDINHGFIIREE